MIDDGRHREGDDPPRQSPSDAPDKDLLASVGYLVRAVQIRIFEAFFDEFGSDGLSPATQATLSMIRRSPGIRQGVIAATLHILDPNMTKLVAELEARGLIVRESHPDDKRSVSLRLTDNGDAFLASVDQRVLDLDELYTASLSGKERAQLISLLNRMNVNLGEGRKAIVAPEGLNGKRRGRQRRST
ncbi:MarR family transcriptional regulator (plasmid) [Agrobacterium tumefaciens]|uniref:MarR family transcriptional regulator n=1 Tax=Agrobacterium tumefaciens TaxID=358 RepID=A0AAP9EA36_AGRTU|nr:MarR family transcriptional regulator [Agrobacterium tumefaciens]NSZ60060.1 MarR family transcriptional regulator [Agrobacterium tumefaciens]QDY97661.1 MarR family transcriptional regulator [Agrobacterium tumefaciens]UXS12784.1 MarR family transcriptional regulator [Agrobacterium tumefaciens]UXS20145.1 MarR family transcriptional regulator [Agrobacterium tumefaciens]UXS27793.1 MarR family transcriptional regulator [Agrobacterium tumefaciens]